MYSRSRCQRERPRERPSKRAAKNVIESRNVSRAKPHRETPLTSHGIAAMFVFTVAKFSWKFWYEVEEGPDLRKVRSRRAEEVALVGSLRLDCFYGYCPLRSGLHCTPAHTSEAGYEATWLPL